MHQTKLNIGIYLIQQDTGQIFPLEPNQNNILGRSIAQEAHTILFLHPAISKTHAIIKIEPNQQWTIQNLSRNGSMLNNKPLTTKKILTHGDEITIGFYKLIFYENLVADEGTMEMPITNDFAQDNSPNSKNYWDDDNTVDTRMENIAICFFIVLSLLIFVYYLLKR